MQRLGVATWKLLAHCWKRVPIWKPLGSVCLPRCMRLLGMVKPMLSAGCSSMVRRLPPRPAMVKVPFIWRHREAMPMSSVRFLPPVRMCMPGTVAAKPRWISQRPKAKWPVPGSCVKQWKSNHKGKSRPCIHPAPSSLVALRRGRHGGVARRNGGVGVRNQLNRIHWTPVCKIGMTRRAA